MGMKQLVTQGAGAQVREGAHVKDRAVTPSRARQAVAKSDTMLRREQRVCEHSDPSHSV